MNNPGRLARELYDDVPSDGQDLLQGVHPGLQMLDLMLVPALVMVVFTVVNVRDDLARAAYGKPGWYAHPTGTVRKPKGQGHHQEKHMNNLDKLGLAALLAAAPFLAWAHATIVKSDPARDAQLAASPPAIVLTFNEPIEPAFSSVKLINEVGKVIAAGKSVVDPADKKVLRTAIPVLINGTYTVQYTTMGRDGHKRTGEYKFTVK